MKTERWFNVLVLGGAMLGQACETAQEDRPNRRGTGSTDSTAGSGGASSPGAGDAGSGGSMAGSDGESSPGGGDAGGGSTAGGAGLSGLGGASSGGASSGGASSGGASSGGAGGMGGSGGELQCHLDSTGHGDLRDPCGCPCCWAKDCLNTEPCCVGFCKSGNDGAGCCPQ